MKVLISMLVMLLFAGNALAQRRTVTIGGESVEFDRLIPEDTNNDGKNDRISGYDGNDLVLTIYDTDRDGQPDLWLTYDRDWNVKSELRDTNRDGKPDVVRHFGDDDIARRSRPVPRQKELAWLPDDDRQQSTKQPPPPPPVAPAPVTQPAPVVRRGADLRLRRTAQYQRVWTDKGSGADEDFAVFRARAAGEFSPIGDTAIASPWPGERYAPPGFQALLVAGGALPVKPPIDYQLTWSVAGSPADTPFASWQPVPPNGYRCLGDVGVADLRAKPPLNAIRCVPQQCVEPARLTGKIWDDSGSDAHDDFSAWSTPVEAVYIGNRSHKQPQRAVYQLRRACFAAGG